jgi:hypothetical protein
MKEKPYTFHKTQSGVIYIPCQGCGIPVAVHVVFIGCAFCEKCLRSKSWSVGSEDIKAKEY